MQVTFFTATCIRTEAYAFLTPFFFSRCNSLREEPHQKPPCCASHLFMLIQTETALTLRNISSFSLTLPSTVDFGWVDNDHAVSVCGPFIVIKLITILLIISINDNLTIVFSHYCSPSIGHDKIAATPRFMSCWSRHMDMHCAKHIH